VPHLFCKIGWMNYYEGLRPDDKITGGGKYVRNNSRGVEMCNFVVDWVGQIYGAVNITRSGEDKTIDIDKLGAANAESVVCDVFFFSTPPTKGQRIVGCYKNATVYRHYQQIPKTAKVHRANKIGVYNLRCAIGDSFLIPVRTRFDDPLIIPSGDGYPSTTQIWYADKTKNQAFVKRVREYIERLSNDPNEESGGDDIQEYVWSEGRKTIVTISKVERKSEARQKKIASAANLNCEICSFNFGSTYGAHGEKYVEVHHIVPLAKRGTGLTTEKDLAIVCANCHRMLHTPIKHKFPRQEPTKDEVAEMIRMNAKGIS
jgi:5-methylcytosine-specific restriction endonuclease McrA